MKTSGLHITQHLIIVCGLFLCAGINSAQAVITPAQRPLYLSVTAAKPNIMLVVDNSMSMSDTVKIGTAPLAPDAVTGSSTTCSSSHYYSTGATTAAGATTVITMQVFSSSAKFCPVTGTCTSSNSTAFGNSTSTKCFNTSKYYNIANLGVYRGDQLNQFFNKYNGSFNGALNSIISSTTRLQIVKNAATAFVNTLKPDTGLPATVRLGLARYNSGATGGELLSAISDLDTTKATAITTNIAGFTASTSTPLAETLSDIGRYFTTGYAGNLTLHPSTSPQTASVAAIFNNHSITNSTGTTLASPIQGDCQKSSVIILSDGLPSSDQTVSSYFQDYDGDCHNANGTFNSNICITNGFDMKKEYAYPGSGSSGANPNGPCSVNHPATCVTSAGSDSSDYLDDVAQALYEMDLRPDLPKISGQKNNLTTYTVGFADPAIDPLIAGVNPLLEDTATQGGGQFVFATDTTTLADALDNFTSDIISKISSSSSVTANSAKLDSSAALYQGMFDSADWTGSLIMYPISASEDTNGNGVLDPGEDTNGNGKLDGGGIGAAAWNAAGHIPAFGTRNILTYNADNTPRGVTFVCANLTADQKTALGISNCSSTTDQGVWRLNYIRGDWSHEEKNPARTDADTIRSATASDRIFRNRTHLNKIPPLVMVPPDPWLLGDIVNSDPVFVGNEDYGYGLLTGVEGTTYQAFVTSNASRRKMIYVGANDGMLHGFDASSSGADAGKEILAYIPNAVYSGLNALSSPDYTHQYLVDGAPRVSDAYFDSAWHTMLVSTTGAGGKAVFGLDVTDPSNFGGSDVLWEISDANSPVASDLTTDTTTLRGFANNMGYALPQPAIARMHDGSWAAIVANGYASDNNLAVLYIINVQTGQLIRAIDTMTGSASTPNGLSSPIAVDSNNDKMVDAIYAGDLLGNMWKFDVSSNNTANWNVANTGAPLFVACTNASNCNNTRQPITAKPQVGAVGSSQTSGGVMVYFGTGKYFEITDNDVTNPQTQTFYGIWDNNAVVSRSSLQSQSIIAEVTSGGFNLRATTDTAVNYPTSKGWYMDLLEPSATVSIGERIVSAPLLRNGTIIFVTLIPIPPVGTAICGAAAGTTGWLMELNGITGKRMPTTGGGPPWDITGDGMINASDLITVIINGQSVAVAPSGKQSTVGGIETPGVISFGQLEYKYTSGTNEGQLEVTTESKGGTSTGSRKSWRQLFQ